MRVGAEGLAQDRSRFPVSPRLRRTSRLKCVAVVAFGAATWPCSAPAQTKVSGGTGTIYVGTYGKKILVVDEASFRVRDSIPVSVGIPIGMLLSDNRKHFYVLDPQFETVETVDIASKKALGKFTLSSGNTKVRIWGLDVDPQERFAVLLVKTYTKQPDRFVIGKPTLLRYDLQRHAVTDTIPWPKGEEREFAQILFSPNGDLLYFFTSDDVLVYETQHLKQVDRWELSRTLFEEGIGRLNFFFPNDIYEERGFYTGLFRATDPVNRRTMMGVARVDLVNRSVDFFTLGPSEPVSFTLAPGRKRAYGIRREIGNYQFWTFDLESRRVVRKVEFKGRPRMGLSASSNGKLLYVHTAGPTIDLYDTENFQHVGTVDLGQDMSDFVLIPPRAATPMRTADRPR